MVGKIRNGAINEHEVCGKEQGERSGMRELRYVAMNEACSVRQWDKTMPARV